jgi:hypothetical protein
MEIRTGMVFALETCCPAKGGFSAARIEEEVVVTDTGSKLITASRPRISRSPTPIDGGHRTGRLRHPGGRTSQGTRTSTASG